jgi:hypothetical protein
MRIYRTAAGLMLATLAGSAFAGPLDRSRVPAGAAWLVHVDIEAAMRSDLMKTALDAKGAMGLDGMSELNDVKEELGLDPLHDIFDVTVFGSDVDGHDAVAMFTTTPAVDEAIRRLKEKGHDYQTLTEGGYDLYAWSEDGGAQYGLVRKIGPERRLMYLSQDKQTLIAAADVGTGRADSLKGRKDSALSVEERPGAMLVIASDVIPRRGEGEMSMVLGKARALRIEAGDNGQDCYAEVELRMASSEDAANVSQVLTGLQAMARMFCQGNPEMSPFSEVLRAQTLSADGASVFSKLQYPTAKLVEAIKAVDRHGEEEDQEEAEPARPGSKEPL